MKFDWQNERQKMRQAARSKSPSPRSPPSKTGRKINWVFVRHGHGCHNALSSIIDNRLVSIEDGIKLSKEFVDPELTPLGVDASLNNGCVISSLVKKIHLLTNKPEHRMDSINIVGCSPLLRSMETAFYMTRNWKNPPKTIFVFPHLREIDESSSNKFSPESFARMEKIPSYAMKSITEQKRILQDAGILQYFDFSFVENFQKERKFPGDIPNFMNWFIDNVAKSAPSEETINAFVVTHAGVLRDFSKKGYHNNSGFFVHSIISDEDVDWSIVSLDKFLPPSFFFDYNSQDYTKPEYYCPSTRCGSLCTAMAAKKYSVVQKQKGKVPKFTNSLSNLPSPYNYCESKSSDDRL